MPEQSKKEIVIESWDYDDGSVGGQIQDIPGNIWAVNEAIFMSGTIYILQIFTDNAEYRAKTGETSGVIDLKMEVAPIEGKLLVRFLDVPGFGIEFSDKDEIQKFMEGLFIPNTPEMDRIKLN